MSRTKRFLGGVTFGYVNQFVLTVVGLWLTPFLLFRIGQHDYGLWLIGTQLLAYLALIDFGVVALLPRATAYATGRAGTFSDAKDLPEIIGQAAWVVFLQTPLVAILAVILWATMPVEWEPLRTPIALVMLAFVFSFPLRIFAAILQGLQDLAFLGRVNLVAWFVGTAITVALVIAGKGLYALAFGWVTTQLLTAGLCCVRLRQKFAEVLPRRLPGLSGLALRSQLTQGFWVTLNQLAVVMLIGTDVVIVGKLLGPAWVVPYVCTAKLVTVFTNQPQMIMQAAMPAMSELRASGDIPRLSNVCVALSQAMLLISGAVVCVVLATNRGFVTWWVGTTQFAGFALTLLVLGSMLLRHLNLGIAYMLFAFGRERRLALTSLFDGAVTVLSAVVLINKLGLVGAPLGLVLGVCLVSLPSNIWALSQANTAPVSLLFRSLTPWFWRFLIVAFAAGVFARRFFPENAPKLILTSAVVLGVYVLIMLRVVWASPLGEYVPPWLTQLTSRTLRAPTARLHWLRSMLRFRELK